MYILEKDYCIDNRRRGIGKILKKLDLFKKMIEEQIMKLNKKYNAIFEIGKAEFHDNM